jgi:hypothetical protein
MVLARRGNAMDANGKKGFMRANNVGIIKEA